MSGSVALVGAGPGDPGLLTVRAARLLAQCDVLVYDALASDPIVALASPHCERIYVGKRSRNHTMPQEEISRLLVTRAQEGKRVVRLKGGDPFVFGRGGEEAQELRAAGVEFEIVPGISSAMAAPAYAGIPVTHRSYNTNFTIATGHEDPTKGISTLDWERLADGHGTSIFLMAMGNLAGIVAELERHGRAPETPVAIISDGTTPRQRTLVATLATVVAAAADAHMAAPAIVVVGEVVAVREEMRWFDRRPLFGQRILLTRPTVDSADLAARLWEEGAEPILAPLIEISEAPHDATRAALFAALQAASPVIDWLVFTSRNGVRSFAAYLRREQLDVRVLGRTKVAVVGPGTAAELAMLGLRPDLVATTASGTVLAAELTVQLATMRAQRIALWTAEGAGSDLAAHWRAAGHVVDIVTGYRTRSLVAPELREQAARATLWTFASASAVRSFVEQLPDFAQIPGRHQVIVIGESTAATARELALTVAAVAAEPTLEALLAAFAQVIPAVSAYNGASLQERAKETSLH